MCVSARSADQFFGKGKKKGKFIKKIDTKLVLVLQKRPFLKDVQTNMPRFKMIYRKFISIVILNIIFLLLFNENLYNYINSNSEIYPKIGKLNDDIYIVSGFWDTRQIVGENSPGI